MNEEVVFSFAGENARGRTPSEFGGFLMTKEGFDVAAAVEDVKYRCVLLLDAIYDDVISSGKASQAKGQVVVSAPSHTGILPGVRPTFRPR